MITVEGLDENFVKKAVDLFCNALNINPPSIHIFVDDTIKPNGACYQVYEDEYLIVLKDQPNDGHMMVTLAHEMVHVKQFISDRLATEFDSSIPYMSRWWEVEAYALEVELTKLLIDAIEKGTM